MSLVDLGGMLVLGLAGSVHCVGMCGGFVLCLSGGGGRRQAAWQAGRAVSYALLGAGLALLGLSARMAWNQSGGRIAVLLASAMMVAVGLGFLGLLPRIEPLARFNPLKGRLAHLLGRTGAASGFALGLLTGLLPCGLLYAALARAAAAGSPAEGASLMLAFWLGTSPLLAGVAGAAPWLRRVGPAWWPRLAGAVTVAIGLVMAWNALQAPAACPHCH